MGVYRVPGKTLFFLALAGLGGLAGWSGCRRPAPRTMVAATAPVRPAPAEDGQSPVQFRLARDAELSRRQEALRELLAAANEDEKVRREAEQELWRLVRVEAAEHEAEAALAVQGWPGATVTLVGDEAAVVVTGRALTAAEAAAVGRLVAKAAGLDEAAVRIVERR